MVRPDRITEIGEQDSSLWLVVKNGTRSYAFEFQTDTARIVTVGSAPHSDVKLEEIEAAPLVCYFERDGEKLWLVPGYRCKQLRVDTTLVERPRRLGWRSIVEFPGMTLEVRVREEPPTSPDNEVPILGMDRPMAVHRVENDPSLPFGKVITIDDQLDEIEEEIPTLVSVPSSRRTGSASIQAPPSTFVEPWEAVPPIAVRPILSIGDASAELVGAMDETRGWELGASPASTWKTTPALTEEGGEPMSMSPSVLSVRVVHVNSRQPLAALGELTRRRPVLVTIGAAVGAMALVLAMSFVSRLTSHQVTEKREGTPAVVGGAATELPCASANPPWIDLRQKRAPVTAESARQSAQAEP